MYRNKKGQFITKKKGQAIARVPFYMTVTAMALALPFGLAVKADVVTYHAEAQEATEWPEWGICELHAVLCEHEQPHIDAVNDAVDAIQDALGYDVTRETRTRVEYLYEKATHAGVSFTDAVKTIYCESKWYSIKSHLPENSYGLAQIHLDSHTTVTREQAMDAYFAIDWLVEHWNDTVWYGYNRTTGQCANDLIINLNQ